VIFLILVLCLLSCTAKRPVVAGVEEYAITLSWTAPGAEGQDGKAFAYQICRFQDVRLYGDWWATDGEGNEIWSVLESVDIGSLVPDEAGRTQTFVDIVDRPGTWYYMMRTMNIEGYWSLASNVAVKEAK